MLSGAIVPHAPLLTIGANSDGIPEVMATIRSALEGVRSIPSDVVILVGPHGPTTGVYRTPAGSLAGFGAPGMHAGAARSEVSTTLAEAWGVPEIDGSDHGVIVPLLLDALPPVPIVACTLADWTGNSTGWGDEGDPDTSMASAARLGEAIASLAADGSVLVVASAHTSAALSPRAPLTEREEGSRLDDRILGALRGDPRGLLDISPSQWAAGGACGAGPLTLFGQLFGGRSCEVLAYEAPVGVGYLVARVP
ncbi:MAG: hypothetical protein GEU71_12700 [Actinobacteria bacterium]|nr:hypothetical protein [Actinomycetota bacterium]